MTLELPKRRSMTSFFLVLNVFSALEGTSFDLNLQLMHVKTNYTTIESLDFLNHTVTKALME